MELYLKHRPKTLGEFAGNPGVVKALDNILERKEGLPRSFLFIGPSGCGKTTLARIIKNVTGCSDEDFYEYNTSNTRGIDTIRDIEANLIYAPLNGDLKIYLLDECHELTKNAQNALLKSLEDTPNHVIFVLATTDPQKLLPTIKSRCTSFEVTPLSKREGVIMLKKVCKKEGLEVETEVLSEILKVSEGRPREAMKLLDIIKEIEDKEEAIAAVHAGTGEEHEVKELLQALTKSGKKDWKQIRGILKGINAEPEKVRYSILGYLNAIVLNTGDPTLIEMIMIFRESYMYTGKAGLTADCYLATQLEN